MWTGEFLAGPWSDQYSSGFAVRQWAVDQWRTLGHFPLWNPEIFGGLPFAGAMHGDIFYPTAWLRLVLPVGLAMNLGFIVHYALAGLFLYLLLRLLKCSWAGSVTGALAYQLSGVIGSYVQPGHDGKLFVTALLPLACIALVLAFRRQRLAGHALLALTVGLGVLSPHPQMLYYLLVAAGIFALYLAFGDESAPTRRVAVGQLGAALAAVLLGFGIGMIQVLPFYEYLPYSPRAETYRGFEEATSYAIPWSHIPELFLAGFLGTSQDGTYWASNPIKLHSEYLGLPVVALSVLGLADPRRRRLVVWLSAIGLLFLLIAQGAATPFYRAWYEVMPFMKKVRAPGMALFVVAFAVSAFAGFGVQRLERGEGKRHVGVWFAAGGVVVLLAALGAVGGFARFLALDVQGAGGRPVAAADAAQGAIRLGAVLSGVALVVLAALAAALKREIIPVLAFAVVTPLVIGADLWLNAKPFWTFTPIEQELLSDDAIIEHLRSTAGPYRVLQIPRAEVYPGNTLMAHGVPQVLGYHGNELHRFDELLGGKNEWRNVGSRNLWDLYAVRFVVVPAGLVVEQGIPGFDRVLRDVAIGSGRSADLYERSDGVRWARLVPAALKLSDAEAIPALANPRSDLDPDRLVLIDPESSHEPVPVSAMPEPFDVDVVVEAWEPGAMRLRISPEAPEDGYLVVGENWYPDWSATVDGVEAQVVRGNVSIITVPVSAGAEQVTLDFRSSAYTRGRFITWLSLIVLVAVLIGPPLTRSRRA
jgi:hypothetical protein